MGMQWVVGPLLLAVLILLAGIAFLLYGRR